MKEVFIRKNKVFLRFKQAGCVRCHSMITFEPYSETNDTVADNMTSVCFPPFPLLLLSLI
ncbi:hypothetical protein BACUNI_00320 [Bacteroides uniformis ATCC 8492]|uniref:Uncharacterized protein n=1 Tax=Bacteroides uniformis (strain ATCC 8492 / DSM 6597 / CCUG 4942 / CIP 103695 / JCM 5828 / KCTC 5204 / NCTC 13054 / VPI 0061) TaxID=411479 RepID=A0ABC9NHD9_BACUC|nr:hypothetical protein BACUNI_00320 [Bacteroides uniformis ATCC 8492]